MPKRIVTRTRAEVYRLWLDALRGKLPKKYKQIDGALKDARGFCCLGVLCDLARRDGGPTWKDNYGDKLFMGSIGNLPKPIANFMGLREVDAEILMCMNDATGGYVCNPQSFKQIADYIETKIMPRALKGK